VGKTTFDKSLNCLKPRGYMVLFGQSSGPVPPVDPQILNRKGSLFLTRPTIGSYTLTEDEFRWRGNDVLDWLASGELKLRIDRTFPLKDASEAHRYMENGQTKGKVLLIP
jgi:NADPH2:quinone reductase